MKRLVLILCLVIFSSSQAIAACDYSYLCAKPYDISSRGGQFVSKATGMTFISEKIANAIIQKELKKSTKAKLKVDMKSYSACDLMHGRFSYLKIYGKHIDIDDTYLTSFKLETLCKFNYVDLSHKTIKFKENLIMNYFMEISNEDLQKTVKSGGYIDMLNKVKLSGMGITFFKLSGADVKLKNNKLYFTIQVTTPFSSNPIPVEVSSEVKVEDGNIVLTKVSLLNTHTVLDLSKTNYILNLINPLTFSTDILNNKQSKMSVQNIEIKGDKIFIDGNIFIPKNI